MWRFVACVFACSTLVAACASPPPKFPPVKAGQLFEGPYVDVRAPNSEGWRLGESSPRGMAFAKRGEAAGESVAAQVLMLDLQPTRTPAEFEALIKEALQRDIDPKRFDELESSTAYTDERGYPCLRHRGVFRDKQAVTSPTTTEALLLQISSLYCRHPVRTTTGFAAIYSYRGRGRYAPLEREAADFIQGVQVPPAGPR
jgi:hypothetical protein